MLPPLFCDVGNVKTATTIFWGHYLSDRRAAEQDLLERAGNELQFQMRHEPKATSKKNEERER